MVLITCERRSTESLPLAYSFYLSITFALEIERDAPPFGDYALRPTGDVGSATPGKAQLYRCGGAGGLSESTARSRLKHHGVTRVPPARPLALNGGRILGHRGHGARKKRLVTNLSYSRDG